MNSALDVTKKEHRKMLLDTFINDIFLYDDKVVITFNFKDGDKTMTLQDITSSDYRCLVHQTTIIRTKSSCTEMGSDFCYGL